MKFYVGYKGRLTTSCRIEIPGGQHPEADAKHTNKTHILHERNDIQDDMYFPYARSYFAVIHMPPRIKLDDGHAKMSYDGAYPVIVVSSCSVLHAPCTLVLRE